MKTCDELLEVQINGIEGIIGWYTNENGMPLGVLELIDEYGKLSVYLAGAYKNEIVYKEEGIRNTER